MADISYHEARLEAMLAKLTPRERERYERLHEETRARYEQMVEDARAEYARYQRESASGGNVSSPRWMGETFPAWVARLVRAWAGRLR